MRALVNELKDIQQMHRGEMSEVLATCASKLSFIDRANLNIMLICGRERYR